MAEEDLSKVGFGEERKLELLSPGAMKAWSIEHVAGRISKLLRKLGEVRRKAMDITPHKVGPSSSDRTKGNKLFSAGGEGNFDRRQSRANSLTPAGTV